MSYDSGGVAVLFKGHSQYGSVATMVDQFAGALRRLGAETAILDTRAPDCVSTVVALLRQNRIRAFLSLNGYGIPSPGQGAGFYGISGAPVMIYFVDHPAYHFPTIRAPLPHLSVSFPTAHHVGFCRDHVRGDIAVRHLPHAAEAAEPAAWDGRDVPLFLSASLIADAEPFRAGWRQHGPEVERGGSMPSSTPMTAIPTGRCTSTFSPCSASRRPRSRCSPPISAPSTSTCAAGPSRRWWRRSRICPW